MIEMSPTPRTVRNMVKILTQNRLLKCYLNIMVKILSQIYGMTMKVSQNSNYGTRVPKYDG